MYRIRARVLVPLLAGLALVLLWPAVPCLKLRGWLQDREMARFAEAQVFKVQRGHLLERLTIEEIEAREWVKDPLNSVPGHPFGHLYAVWCTLRVKVRLRDELWSFKAQWHDGWGRPDSRAGYVVWRRGESAGHILTVLKRLEESSGACQSSASASGNPAISADEIELPDFLRRQAD